MQSGRSLLRTLLYFLILGIFIAWVYQHFHLVTKIGALSPSYGQKLQIIVTNDLKDAPGSYSVAIKNLKTGESFYLNEHQPFDSGSLYKLWIMGETLERIKSGDVKFDESLSGDVSELNNEFNIPPDQADLEEGEIQFSVDSALTQMVTISHNYAALLLTKRVGLSSVASYLQKNQFNESKVGTDYTNPQTTAFDIEQFFEKLYKGQLADKDSTNKMLDLLKAQQLNNKIPRNLPQGTVVAHKTGEIGGFSHDGGIVYNKNGDYVIVLMSESDIPSDAEDKIAQISGDVFNYFNSK